MMKIVKVFIILISLFIVCGCSGIQKSFDRKILGGVVGKKYTDITGETGGFSIRFGYGPLLTSEKLPDNSFLYIHVIEYVSSGSTFFGIYGYSKYSYRIYGFKVKDGIVTDWAYGLFVPEKEYTRVFGMVFVDEPDTTFTKIKNEYDSMIKTSNDEDIFAWRKSQ